MRTTTIKEQGSKLPVGVPNGNVLVKDFALRPHNAKIDRLLNIWREANKGQHIAWEVCKYLSLIVASIGEEAIPLDAKGDSTVDSISRFLSLSFGDVMYLWMYARIAAVKEKCQVPYGCPVCGYKGNAIIDLWGTEVLAVDELKDTETWLDFETGLTLSGGKRAKALCLKPAPFSAMLLQGATAESTDSIGYGQVRECVARVKGIDGPYILSDDELDSLSKLDWLRLDRRAGKVSGGPKLRTPIDCEGSVEEGEELRPCGHVITQALDWSYDSFFDSSVPLGSLMT